MEQRANLTEREANIQFTLIIQRNLSKLVLQTEVCVIIQN